MEEGTEYHPAIQELLDLFEYGHLPPPLKEISRGFGELAEACADHLDGSCLTKSLNHLKIAKDWAINAKVLMMNKGSGRGGQPVAARCRLCAEPEDAHPEDHPFTI